MNYSRIAIAAAGVALVCALFFNGVFVFFFFACLLAAIVLLILRLRSGDPPPPIPQPPVVPQPPLHNLPMAGQNAGAGAGAAVAPKTRTPVFEESIEFSKLDPQKDKARRIQLVQQVDTRISKSVVMTKRDIEKADAGDFELDRIGLYIWEARSGEWPDDRSRHVQNELDLARASGPQPSLMALEHAMESFNAAVGQGRAGLRAGEGDLLVSVHDSMKDYPGRDDAAKILKCADGLLSAAPAAPASQSQAAPQAMLSAYEEIRGQRVRDLANQRLIPLHVASLQVFMNLNDNGDIVINERYEVVSSEDGPIDFLPTALPRDYSFVPDGLKYDDKPADQSIEWKFDIEGATSGSARVLFDPPIGREPISYSRHWTRFNAVYFNQRDRRDSGVPGLTEDMSFPVRYRYDKLSFRIAFPKRLHPASFRVECKPILKEGEGKVDADESAWAQHAIDWDKDVGVVWLNLSEPLPGHSYALVWDLPPVDAGEMELTSRQSGIAEDLNRRFLALRDSSSRFREPALAALKGLATDLQEHFGDDLHVRLFAYISENGKGGLIEVLESAGGAAPLDWVMIGRTTVGRSFARKQGIVRYQSIEVRNVDKWFEKIPSEATLSNPCVAVAMPLLYPGNTGRRLGVLYVSTWNRDSQLLPVGVGIPETTSFGVSVVKWFANDLWNALEMPNVYELGRTTPVVN
jgi:hypothetical protein